MGCYKCIYRGKVPGDAHSCCRYPGNKTGLFDFLEDDNIENIVKLNISISRHGFNHGWAYWPVNFDPVWINNCDGFTEKA